MLSNDDIKLIQGFRRKFSEDVGLDPEMIRAFIDFGSAVIEADYGDRRPILRISQYLIKKAMKIAISQESSQTESEEALYLYWQVRLFEAQHRQLDSYLLFLERKRDPSEKFYQPKRKLLMKHGLIDALQRMLDDELDLLAISMPPGTGKTTLSKFFLSAVIGWWPKDFNLFFSHSSDIARMYYDGVLDIVTDKEEYAWQEVFPSLRANKQNAKMQQFNVGKYKPFPSLQCTSRSSNNAGVVRCSKYLMVDDLVAGIEEALNKNTLEKLWNIYSVDARQRKIDGCKEIHIATRWSVADCIGRLKIMYEDDKRVAFIEIPDIDPKTEESNFLYDFNGFTAEFFHEQEMAMDDISYQCLYKQEPIEREGLLYHEDELRRYLAMPGEEPDAILGICDSKSTGIDYMFLPVFYQYGDDYYLADCICDDSSDFGVQYGRIAEIILEHNVQQCEFESNAGGDRIAFEVNKRLEAVNGRCNITTKPTETNKETRIIVNSDWIKKHCLFREKGNFSPKDDYGRMMKFLLSYSVAGKNKHDDVPDGLANFALFVTRGIGRRQTMIMRSPI